MKGDTLTINGDLWTVVDVAPAHPLAEMVATILEDEGLIALTRGVLSFDAALSALGADAPGATLVLVPEGDAERALAIIAETVTDYEEEELERLLEELEEADAFAPAEGDDLDHPETDH